MRAIYSLQPGPDSSWTRRDRTVPDALLFKSYLPGAIFDHNNGIDKTAPLMQNAWGRIFFLFCPTTFRRDGGVAAVILKPANPEDVNENVSRLCEEKCSRCVLRREPHASQVKGNTWFLRRYSNIKGYFENWMASRGFREREDGKRFGQDYIKLQVSFQWLLLFNSKI